MENNELFKTEIEEFHPNWRALSTINFQYKRFVTPKSTLDSDSELKNETKKCKNNIGSNISGEEVKQFYENIIQEKFTETIPKDNNTTSQNKDKRLQVKRPVQCVTSTSNNFDENTFFRAATANDIDSIKSMNIPKEELDTPDQYGWTALMMAACENATKTFEYLLQLGADLTISDKKGLTAFDLATKKGNFGILKIITEFQANKNTNKLDNSDKNKKAEQKFENFFCKICNKEFFESNKFHHETSTLHQFNRKREKKRPSLRFSIPPKNRGFKIMLKQGWNEDNGLGPSGKGNLYPVKTVIRKERSGLGIEQKNVPKVTHFEPYDLDAIKYRHNYSNRQPRRNEMRREQRREQAYEKKLRTELS